MKAITLVPGRITSEELVPVKMISALLAKGQSGDPTHKCPLHKIIISILFLAQ